MSASATLPHPDRLTTRERSRAGSPGNVELAVRHLVWLMAGDDCDELTALEAIARAAARLAAQHRDVPTEEDRPVASAGMWALENGMLPHVILGES